MDTRNPYAAPQADALQVGQTFESAVGLNEAPLGTRFANFALDTIFRSVGAFGLAAIVGAMHLTDVAPLLAMLGILGYHVFFESLTGRTPAKYITGTRVVDVMGSKPSFLQILGRSAARFIPFEPFSFLGSNARGWHDTMSRTRVVRI